MERLDSSSAIHPDSAGWTLILPCVSVGHVGQQAVDLLLGHLQAERVCALHHPSLYPVAGASAVGQSSSDSVSLNSALELHVCKAARLVILQQRSPCIPGMKADFCNSLVQWIGRQQLRQVVVLSSLDSQMRADDQLYGDQLRYVSNAPAEKLLSEADVSPRTLGWLPLEVPAVVANSEVTHMLGSGLAKRIMSLLTDQNVPTTLVLPFSQTYAQTAEAQQTVFRLNQWLSFAPAASGHLTAAMPEVEGVH